MIEHHHTATCPNCNRDSYQPETAAFFTVVKCAWCDAYFTYSVEKHCMVVCDKDKK